MVETGRPGPAPIVRTVKSLSQALSRETGVEIVVWPQDESLRVSLARAGVPRLLVLGADDAPPDQIGFDEDWIREPCEPLDLEARMRRVAAAVAGQSSTDPWIDRERVLHRGPRTTVLTVSEAVVAETLLSSIGSVVSRALLESRLWPGGTAPSARAVDAVVYRLRRRCRDLGIMIRTARGEGFVLLAGPA